MPGTTLLTRIGQETDNQENRSAEAWTKQQSIVATGVCWQPCSNRVDGVLAFAEDLGRVVPIRLHIDSSAALSKPSRTGLGKVKHIEIQYLWLQEAVRNSSDLGTKNLTSERSDMFVQRGTPLRRRCSQPLD